MATRAALNDEEVHAEMRKMVAFISQEAMEKAREIRVKADEEFNIEKAKLVRSEAIHIENSFTKKVKQSSVQRKMFDEFYFLYIAHSYLLECNPCI